MGVWGSGTGVGGANLTTMQRPEVNVMGGAGCGELLFGGPALGHLKGPEKASSTDGCGRQTVRTL